MGATYREFEPELTDDFNSFFDRVGLLHCYKDIEPLGFYLDNFTGIFNEKRLKELSAFCENNFAYHIVTQTHPGRYENRYVPDCGCYFLADGDKNPNLVLNPFLKKNAELCSEEVFDKALAMILEINRCDKGK